MEDRNVQFPHRHQLVPVAGQADTYDIIRKPGVVTEEGTPINKATLLSDATAALYGLTGEDATVDGALGKAFSSNLNYKAILTSIVGILKDTDQTILSLTLPKGTYVITALCSVKKDSTTGAEIYSRLLGGTTTLCSAGVPSNYVSNTFPRQMTLHTIATFSGTTTVVLQARVRGVAGTAEITHPYVAGYDKATQISAIKIA